jgi:protein TonB
MMLSLLMLAQAATAAPPPPAQVPIFSTVAPPQEAIDNRWNGNVKADLTVSAEGRVTACKIVQSSGHRVLDDFTCNVLVMRARFTPAKDKDGNPVESHYLTPPITYKFGN